jgi:hypothetical protein
MPAGVLQFPQQNPTLSERSPHGSDFHAGRHAACCVIPSLRAQCGATMSKAARFLGHPMESIRKVVGGQDPPDGSRPRAALKRRAPRIRVLRSRSPRASSCQPDQTSAIIDQGGKSDAMAMEILASQSAGHSDGALGLDLLLGGPTSRFGSDGSARPVHGSGTTYPSAILPKD